MYAPPKLRSLRSRIVTSYTHAQVTDPTGAFLLPQLLDSLQHQNGYAVTAPNTTQLHGYNTRRLQRVTMKCKKSVTRNFVVVSASLPRNRQVQSHENNARHEFRVTRILSGKSTYVANATAQRQPRRQAVLHWLKISHYTFHFNGVDHGH